MAIHKGDDTDAFGFSFLTVNLDNPHNYVISKAEIRIGTVKKIFLNPVFPLQVSLNKEETAILSEVNNECHMAIYDSQGKKWTCDGHVSFKACPKVV